jgi:hypothetical protein
MEVQEELTLTGGALSAGTTGTTGVRWTVRPVCAVSSTTTTVSANARAASSERLRAGYSLRSDGALEVYDDAPLSGLAEPGRTPARIEVARIASAKRERSSRSRTRASILHAGVCFLLFRGGASAHWAERKWRYHSERPRARACVPAQCQTHRGGEHAAGVTYHAAQHTTPQHPRERETLMGFRMHRLAAQGREGTTHKVNLNVQGPCRRLLALVLASYVAAYEEKNISSSPSDYYTAKNSTPYDYNQTYRGQGIADVTAQSADFINTKSFLGCAYDGGRWFTHSRPSLLFRGETRGEHPVPCAGWKCADAHVGVTVRVRTTRRRTRVWTVRFR